MNWRASARQCPTCNKLRSARWFLSTLTSCVNCESDNIILKSYKKCPSCRRFFPREESKYLLCDTCRKYREKNKKPKNAPSLTKSKKYVCEICKKEKFPVSFPRGSDPIALICRKCITEIELKKNGKFRCSGCGSVFLIAERYWNKYCERCYIKNRDWNRKTQIELRKDPAYRLYMKEYSRHRYWNVFKVEYNKVLMLQWAHGLAKKRKRYRDGFWYVLNRSLFEDFKKNFKKWESFTQKVITAMKTGKGLQENGENQFCDYMKKARTDPDWVRDNLE